MIRTLAAPILLLDALTTCSLLAQPGILTDDPHVASSGPSNNGTSTSLSIGNGARAFVKFSLANAAGASAPHESSITLADDWLVREFKSAFPDCDE